MPSTRPLSLAAAAAALLFPTAFAFTVVRPLVPRSAAPFPSPARRPPPRRGTAVFMGRAAAVRAKTKGKTDALKAKVNGQFGKKIIMAVKDGGSPDPNANRMLADLIKQAKLADVPADNIKNAIKRASESADSASFAESVFEAYAAGGASLVVNVLTDNPNRAAAEVKNCFKKNDAKSAESGSVLFMYDKVGVLEVASAPDEDALLDAAIEADCDDYEVSGGEDGGTFAITVQPKDVQHMKVALAAMGVEPTAVELRHVSKAPVECTEEDFEKNMVVIDALEELDDVDVVEHNMSN